MLKLADNPAMLHPAVESIQQLTGRWWVAHTKARHEKAFAKDLHRGGIAYFLPMIRRIRFSGGRRRHVMLPLFPSYVFICGSEGDRHRALTTDRLCQMIEVNNQRQLIEELSSVHRALSGQAPLDPYAFVAAGRRCRVTRGPFKGIEGIVIERQGATHLVLQVSMLGRGAIMEIDADLIEPIYA